MEISVLIPTYNCARFIGAAIESALRQTYPAKEIVVVNNGSTDDTDAVMQPFLEQHKHIRYIKKIHEGIPEARNRLVEEAACGVVSFLDADDLWEADKLRLQAELMEARGCDMVLCALRNFYDESVSDPTAAQRLLYENPMKEPLNGALIKKSVFQAVGLFDPKHNTCTEDVDWLIRSKAAGIHTGMVDTVCYLRRVHSDNSSILLNYDSAHAMHMIAVSLRRSSTRGE